MGAVVGFLQPGWPQIIQQLPPDWAQPSIKSNSFFGQLGYICTRKLLNLRTTEEKELDYSQSQHPGQPSEAKDCKKTPPNHPTPTTNHDQPLPESKSYRNKLTSREWDSQHHPATTQQTRGSRNQPIPKAKQTKPTPH
ncbi:hypothetical protein M9H77_30221 [Catharanthus roseus]|uniref:Uncharacterized protein n=1 Tax=Catharanthus roseus TaxID=4058 RepID=A0ACB9ZWZ6_CATRO|nr:hypothetical protein M9H77_30221 [Catharanthus roseus]